MTSKNQSKTRNNDSYNILAYSPEQRMAALALLLRVLDKEKTRYKQAYILSPSGERISFCQARDMFVTMIEDLSKCKK